jgi:hypothetical protein
VARSKATFKTVDLSRAINAARAAGLTISMTRIEPDGSIILNHGMLDSESRGTDADDALAQWRAKRQRA